MLVGDLVYSWLVFRLARRSGRDDVTAMPFGIDTPSLFGIVFGVMGPVMLLTKDPMLAWKVGMGITVVMGLCKLGLAFGGEWVRRVTPRAGLLGSIAGVAILLIAFLPALKVFADPLVGLTSPVIILVALVGGFRLPWGLPGAFVAVAAGALIFWGREWVGWGGAVQPVGAIGLRLAFPWPTGEWLGVLDHVWRYLPVALPFALATVIGGIDNTESAIAAGDDYRTRDILLTEAVATVAAGVCGGVIQNTPYIGHPAYKAMGARAGYTLATGLVIGLGSALGLMSLLVALLPEAAVAPILIFVGLQITAQAFGSSPARHAPAVAIAFLPVIAALVLIELHGALSGLGKSAADLAGEAPSRLPGHAGGGQRLHSLCASLGSCGGVHHRSAAPAGRSRLRVREPGHALRSDPLAAPDGSALLSLERGLRRSRRAGRCLRGHRVALLAPWTAAGSVTGGTDSGGYPDLSIRVEEWPGKTFSAGLM